MEWFFALPKIVQATLAGCITWFMTGIGAFIVFPLKNINQKLMDGALGLAGGIMVAASFYSLLNPAMDHAIAQGVNPVIPLTVGFLIGAIVICLADYFLPIGDNRVRKGRFGNNTLLFASITLHNIPEGLAIGVAIGAAATNDALVAALALAAGIGIQNLPEGAAISLPLRRDGSSAAKSFFYGQASALVEPIGACLGALLIVYVSRLLPYALTFAAGAMLYVVFAEIIPEAHANGNKRLVAVCSIVGFAIMMFLDVLLG